ncbi:sugar ABC transporter substrate-binding protein [Frondihabitans sucicola]|uniref:Sugar ABC transporter substrate-binding protein n=1 Tax=Frondihabitans sucicola TaxID=1268041 RepID=A0ABM8GHR2_9MICO|nr:hypothetical protein [Frondihabitans sucicola]BDZ47915.1 sugar ABC transporter substrate-binding protein [Frondihabitans sucicola]
MAVSRRTFLTGIGAGILGVGAVGSLASCSTTNVGAEAQAMLAREAPALPDYVPYTGVTPDLPGNAAGLAQGFFDYPEHPKTGIAGAPPDIGTVSILNESPSPTPAAHGRNAYWQQVEKDLGARLDVTVIPTANWTDKFATTVAGGDLADISEVWTPPQRAAMMPAVFEDVAPYVSGDKVREYPFLANLPTASWKSAVFGGGIFGVPVPRGAMSSLLLFRRDDVIEAKGLNGDPGSFDEFLQLCKDLTETRKNTWAVGGMPWETLQMMWHVPQNWRLDKGRLTSAYTLPETREALAAGIRLAKAGVLDPDSFSSNVGTLRKTWFMAGTVNMVTDTFPAWNGYVSGQTVGKKYRIGAMPVPGHAGGHATRWIGNPTHGLASIRRGQKPERVKQLLALVNHLASPFGTTEYLRLTYGVEGVDWKKQGTNPIATERSAQELGLGLMYIGAPPQVFYYPGRPDVVRTQHAAQAELLEHSVQDPTLGLVSTTNQSVGATLTQNISTVMNDIWQGRQPLSAWDDAVATWRSAGGDTIRDEYEKALDQQGGTTA